MDNNEVGWGKELAGKWTNYFPPCRVSNSELLLHTEALKQIRKDFQGEKIKILILGSTPEYRDWAHEEFLDTTIIDFSSGYYVKISEQMKYKNACETFVNQLWQNMDFKEEFHMVVGDLVVGNVRDNELENFLVRINSALVNGGVFITKSFFIKDEVEIESLESLFKQKMPSIHNEGNIFSKYIYPIAISCVDKERRVLSFLKMYQNIKELHSKGIIDDRVFEVFSHLGWQDNMKFGFYMPRESEWEDLVLSVFNKLEKRKSSDIYSNFFDVYFISK